MTIIDILSIFGGGLGIFSAIFVFGAKLGADSFLNFQKGEISKSVETAKAELSKDLEKHKTRLKREELLFEREIELTKAFVGLRHSLQPSYRPGMDWNEAAEDFASDLGAVETKLNVFRLTHYHLMPKPIQKKFDALTTKAMEEKWSEESYVTKEAKQAGKDIMTGLDEIEKVLIDLIQK